MARIRKGVAIVEKKDEIPLEVFMKAVKQGKRRFYTEEEMKARAKAIAERIINDDSPNGLALKELARDLGKL